MATLLLSAAGAAVGSTVPGSFLGLTGAVVGRAVGAAIGRVIDQKMVGRGSEAVEVGRVDRFRLSGATPGAPVAQIFGRMRLGGQVIWATQFKETVTVTTTTNGGGGGGKGAPSQPQVTTTTTSYDYSISLACALCEGPILRVGRIWADGMELAPESLTLRVYKGSEDQLPDPRMEAVEGAGQVPAYRGIAYVVIEDLDLGPFGNRVPQFSFEVMRAAQPEGLQDAPLLHEAVKAIALMPGTGEYALATSPVTYRKAIGQAVSANVNTPAGVPDMRMSMEALTGELPQCESVSLIVSWFGDDLRAGQCSVRPKVEQTAVDGVEMPWSVAGLSRAQAQTIAQIDGRPVYGGTPTDQSVIQAVQAIHTAGKSVLFYPFLLMDQLAQNGKTDPYTGAADQPAFPWRGRITGDVALGRAGSTDQTASNGQAVAAFFRTARATDFTISSGAVSYSGPQEWSYRRFILHCAAVCAAAGGVESFCIGSEMRGLTWMRDDFGFPAVQALRELAANVRQILPNAKLSYAADWSEYFGFQPQDGSGDVYFHLDALWSDPNIDFVAIDNYMRLSDWRDGKTHADATWGSIYDLEYLRSNIEGGEGFDWYYDGGEAREDQRRSVISDGSTALVVGQSLGEMNAGVASGFLDAARNETVVLTGLARLEGGSDAVLWRAGDAVLEVAGGELRLDAGGLQISKSVSDLPFDGLRHEVTWELRPQAPARLRLWIDAELIAETEQSAPMSGSVWATAGPMEWLARDAGPLAAYDSAAQTEADAPWVYRYKAIRDWWQNPHFDRRGTRVLPRPTSWQPMSKPIWFTEIGCAAIDKGTNLPNKFYDPKSTESGFPHYSNGRRDDYMQMQYIRAVTSYWEDSDKNPISPIYNAPMLDTSRSHVWAWDARPWPAFPNRDDLWSDGENYGRGNWISGRVASQPLAAVVAEICERAGMSSYDVSGLHGVVRGHVSADLDTGRARLQPLMTGLGFQAVERAGMLTFLPLPNDPVAILKEGETAIDEEDGAGFFHQRAGEVETVGRLRIGHTESDGAYEDRVVEAIFPDDTADTASDNDLPLVMLQSEAQNTAERWLAQSRVARDSVSFSLPPSRREVVAGCVIALPDGSAWRVDQVEDTGALAIEAVRVEPTSYDVPDGIEAPTPQARFVQPVPVSSVFMDLPLLSGTEVEHAPTLAIAADPWPGHVAVYSAPSSEGFALNSIVETGSVVGVLEDPLQAARSGLWDRGAPVRVRITGGDLSSSAVAGVLNGANVAAIGTGNGETWEVIQFADAKLTAPDIWEIGLRLRGQAGTDALMPPIWPAGSLFVLLDGRQKQLDLPMSARGLIRHYRVGPAARALDDPSYEEHVLAFEGVGLRPLSPVHLRVKQGPSGLDISWIRRTRVDGDTWQGTDVPLGEEREAYLLRLRVGADVKREVMLSAPQFSYSDAMRASDGIGASFTIEVAQLSDRFGQGPFTRIEIND